MIKIKNIMSSNVITVSKESSIMGAAKIMTAKSVSSLVVVVVEKNMPIAMITEGDIIKGILLKKTKVKDIMNKKFMTVPPKTRFSAISKASREEDIKRFPVVEHGKLIGLITETDIIEATRDFTRFHQILQDSILTIFGLATAFFMFYLSPFGKFIFR